MHRDIPPAVERLKHYKRRILSTNSNAQQSRPTTAGSTQINISKRPSPVKAAYFGIGPNDGFKTHAFPYAAEKGLRYLTLSGN